MAGSAPLEHDQTAVGGRSATAADVLPLTEVDPELTAGIPEADRELAERVLARPVIAAAEGPLDLDSLCSDDGDLCVLIVEGAVVRQLDLLDRHCTAIFGPGDVVGTAPPDGLLEVPTTWRALRATKLMLLDARFTRAAQRWPSLTVNLHRRLLEQSHRSAVQAAISQLPRVELRVLALLWHLAERWGKVTPFGVEVGLELTHEALGRLIGAQRPTVTLAIGDLTRDGAVTRTVRRTWLLSDASRDVLRADDAAPSSPA